VVRKFRVIKSVQIVKPKFVILGSIKISEPLGGRPRGGRRASSVLTVVCRLVSSARLLIYGQYCSHMENAQKTLDELIATREDVKITVEVTTAVALTANT